MDSKFMNAGEDLVSVPRDLLASACYVLRKHAPDSNTLARLSELSLREDDAKTTIRAVTVEMRNMMPNACGKWADRIEAALSQNEMQATA
jgi:hypothetical protein